MHIEDAKKLQESDRYCTCCERALKTKIRWLELDQRTNTYHDLGGIPEEHSQGWFPFGLGCATTRVREHKHKVGG